MRTKNFINLMAMMFIRSGTAKGLLPVTGRDGVTYYVGATSPGDGFPRNVNNAFQLNANNAGFCVGSGTTAATENDYELASMITSGLTASVAQNAFLDNQGNPTATFDLTITNSGSEAVTIAEIGYKQAIRVTTEQGGTSFSDKTCLIDRTVLDEPVTIPAGEFAVIRYTLKTDI